MEFNETRTSTSAFIELEATVLIISQILYSILISTIYIYIYRERGGGRKTDRQRQRDRDRETERDKQTEVERLIDADCDINKAI